MPEKCDYLPFDIVGKLKSFTNSSKTKWLSNLPISAVFHSQILAVSADHIYEYRAPLPDTPAARSESDHDRESLERLAVYR